MKTASPTGLKPTPAGVSNRAVVASGEKGSIAKWFLGLAFLVGVAAAIIALAKNPSSRNPGVSKASAGKTMAASTPALIAPSVSKKKFPPSASPEARNTSSKNIWSFTACGKEWRVFRGKLNWDYTQAWINSLGRPWRSPRRYELKELSKSERTNLSIRRNSAWAEKEDDRTAWYYNFREDIENRYERPFQDEFLLAVAVREQ